MKLTVLLCCIVLASNAAPLILHVSPNGNDTASGAANAPIASLPAALEAARTRRAPGDNVSLVLHAGTFVLKEPLKLSPADSDTTIAAFGNDKPMISGGQRITGWRKVRENLWQAEVPGVRDGKWYFRQLFINGTRATRARTPNEGSYFQMAGERFSDKPAQFHFKPGDIKSEWAADPDAEIVGLEKWTVFREHIAALMTESNVVQLSGNAAPHTHESGAQYYIENIREALDASGEWHLDRKTGVVSYLARPGEDLTKAEVIAPVLEDLVSIAGDAAAKRAVTNIILRGLTFSYTDWSLPTNGYVDTQAAVAKRGTVRAEFARNIAIEDCIFAHLANYAIEFGRGAQNCRAVGNEMTDLGAGGVRMVKRRCTQTTSTHQVIMSSQTITFTTPASCFRQRSAC